MAQAEVNVRDERRCSEQFLAACRDTRKAWASTRLLATLSVVSVREAKQTLREGDANDVAKLLTDMAGPMFIFAGDLSAAPVASRGPQLAGLALAAIVAPRVAGRGQGQLLSVEAVKEDVAHWIDFGLLPGEAQEAVSEAARIAAFLAEQSAAAGHTDPAALRLAVVAAVAAPLEGARFVCGLDEALLDNLDDDEALAARLAALAAVAGEAGVEGPRRHG